MREIEIILHITYVDFTILSFSFYDFDLKMYTSQDKIHESLLIKKILIGQEK